MTAVSDTACSRDFRRRLIINPSCGPTILSDNHLDKFRDGVSESAVLARVMFFDLNVPIPALQPPGVPTTASQSKKGKAVAKHAQSSETSFSSAQIAAIENRVELLTHRPSCVRRLSRQFSLQRLSSWILGLRVQSNRLQKT